MKPNDLPVSGKRSFFIPGGTLPGDAPSYVTRQADHNLLEGLRGGQFCYVLTSRQMGKSSLMVRVANQLREEGVAVAVLDLTTLGQNLAVEQWYFGLLEQLGRHLRLENELDAYWQSHKSLGPMQRWMAAIRDVVLSSRSQQIVVFVDEIDIVRSLPFSTDEFFAAIRECYNRRAQEPQYTLLTFCLLGVATPNDLIKNTLMTPFNIGRRIELTDFTPEEAATLSVGISVTDRDGRALLNRVLYWTGGHPYLTQRLCKLVAEDTAALQDEDVDRLCANLFLAHKAMESDDNLQFVRNRLLQSEVDLTALLDLYARVRQDARVADDETNPLTSVLKLSGIARVERGELKVRNRIYAYVFNREWVRAHIPGAELRRQQAAYRQGLMRAGAMASAVVGVMGCLTFWAVQAQQQANRYRVKAEKAATAERTLSALSDQQRKEAERTAYFADMKLISNAYEAKQYDRIGKLLEDAKQEKYRPYHGFEWGYWNRLKRLNLLTQAGQADNITANAFSPEIARTGMVSGDKMANVWNMPDDQRTLMWREPNSTSHTYTLALSPDGTRIVRSVDHKTAQVCDARTGREVLTLESHVDLRLTAFSPNGQRIIGCVGWGSNAAREAIVWDAQTGKKILTLKGAGYSDSIVISPNNQWILGMSSVWDARTGQKVLTLVNSMSSYAAFSPDGTRIVMQTGQGTMQVWDATTGQAILTLEGHTNHIYSVAFSPDGTRFAAGSGDNTVSVWDARTGKKTLTLLGHSDTLFSVAFSPDGQRIVTGSYGDNAGSEIKVWDALTGREILALPKCKGGVYPIAFSPDGRRIFGMNDDLVMWFSDPID